MSPYRVTIRREGWYYLLITAVVLGGAIFKEVNLLLVLGGMLLGSALLSWHAVRANLRGLSVERELPRTLAAGDPLSVRLRLTNARRWLGAWAVVVEEQVRRVTPDGPDEPPLDVNTLFPYVAARQSCNGSYRGRLTRRGRYQLGPLRLSTRFPFGLFSRTVQAGQTETLIVLPRVGRLSNAWAARHFEAFAGIDRRRTRPGNDGDFYGLREWRTGDARRYIHWRTSARLGKPVVRQFERPKNSDAAVVLDVWRPASPGISDFENVELAVSFAATLIADLCRKGGGSVYLVVQNSRPECSGGAGSPAILQSLMERLATVEPQCADLLPTLLDEAMHHVPTGCELVIVSTRAIDLSDARRRIAGSNDPSHLDRLSRARFVDTSNENLSAWFQPE